MQDVENTGEKALPTENIYERFGNYHDTRISENCYTPIAHINTTYSSDQAFPIHCYKKQ
jgi:hypothetical protein